MQTITLPNTRLNVSPLCLGTAELGSSVNRDDSFRLLDDYVEQGGNFLDTAHIYGDWTPSNGASVSERTIGIWMQERSNRDTIVLATKGVHWLWGHPDVPRVSPSGIQTDLDESLRFLQTDRIDLYWLHRDDPLQPIEPILQTLHEQQIAGKIRYYGASNWDPTRLRQADRISSERGYSGFVADQILWNPGVLAGRPYGAADVGFMDDDRFFFHEKTGMAVLAFQSQALGLFQRLADGTLDSQKPHLRNGYRWPETDRRFTRIQTVMRETGFSITQVVLGFLRGQPFPTIPIIGSRTREQLADSMTASDSVLTPEQIRYIVHG